MIIKLYELTESEMLQANNLEEGSYICCTDTSNIYYVKAGNTTPTKMGSDVIITTEPVRADLLAPQNKFYFCTDTVKLWYYGALDWQLINPDAPAGEIDLENVVLPASGSLTLSDSRIVDGMTGTFYPDLSVADLVTNLKVAVTPGQAVITGTTSYDIPGTLKLK